MTLMIAPRVISRHQKQRLTYHELDLKSNSLARGLQESGVGKGDRVAVFLGNNIEYSIVKLQMSIGEFKGLNGDRQLMHCSNSVPFWLVIITTLSKQNRSTR